MIIKPHELNNKMIKSEKKSMKKKVLKNHERVMSTSNAAPSNIRRYVSGANNFYNLILIYIY